MLIWCLKHVDDVNKHVERHNEKTKFTECWKSGRNICKLFPNPLVVCALLIIQ